MNWNSVKALAAALLLGVAVNAADTIVSTAPARAAQALRVENKALVEAVNGAQADAKAGKYAEALEKAKAADAIQGKPAQLTRQIHQMIVAYALQAKNYNEALAMLDKMIASGEGDKNKNLTDALGISLQIRNQERANGYIAQLGSNLNPQTRLFIAQGYVRAKRYKEALEMVAPLRSQPSEPLLLFLQATYDEMNDAPNRRATLEALVADYPKPQYWHDLLQLARNERGLSDEQSLDIQRLRLAVGDFKTEADYQEMAQLALVALYPNEAKDVLDQAAKAKLLSGERADRLVKMTNDRVGQDQRAIADLQRRSSSDPNAALKLGMTYWTYGKNMEAEAAIRSAMKGKLADPEAAKQALGHVLFSLGKKAEAVAAFNAVARNSKQASISRLWAIYARRG